MGNQSKHPSDNDKLRVGHGDAERRSEEELISRQTAVLQAINDVFQKTLTCETEEELGKTCLAVAEKLTGSKFGFLGELNPAGFMDTLAISNPGWDACKMAVADSRRHIKNMPIRGIDRSIIRDGKSRIVNQDEMVTHPDRCGTPEGHPEITAFLGVPLKHMGKTIGMIGLGNKQGGYVPADQEAVEALSVAIVEALRYKRAADELRKYREHLEERTAALQKEANERKQAEEKLRTTNYQLGMSEKQLREANQQLVAREEELVASNQQLHANEQQLRAANQQLQASEQQLRAANQQLLAEVAERKRAEEKIQASLREKEVLIKEIHHRVKNNMQIISSILNLQSKHIEDEQALKVFKNGQSRIRSMALVHEKLYESEDLAKIDFAEYIRSNTSYLFSLHRISEAIGLNIDIKDIFLDINTAIPCGLIINELVSNALKYAFPGGREGEIRIGLSSDEGDKLTMLVQDNGIGFPKDMDFRNTESLGMQLVITLVEQMEGTIELERKEGTTFTITFEKPKSMDGESNK